jgi:hypothetical protein
MNFLTKLSEAKSLSDERAQVGLLKLGVQFGCSDEDFLRLYRGGWVHIYPIGKDLFCQYGLRAVPGLPLAEWPVVKIYDFNRAVTFAPNLASFLPFLKVMPFIGAAAQLEVLQKDWAAYLEYAQPFGECFGAGPHLELVRQFMEQEISAWHSKAEDDAANRYTKLWLQCSGGAQDFNALAQRINQYHLADYEGVLALPLPKGASIWVPKIAQVMLRAANRLPLGPLKSRFREELMWALLSLLPIDVLNANVKTLPETGLEFYMDYAALMSLWVDCFPNESEARSGALWYLYEQMEQYGKHRYNGRAHLEAAALFDAAVPQGNAPWNLLLVGAYWAGKNQPQLLEPIVAAAQHLSQTNNWLEIKEMLSLQHERFKGLS